MIIVATACGSHRTLDSSIRTLVRGLDADAIRNEILFGKSKRRAAWYWSGTRYPGSTVSRGARRCPADRKHVETKQEVWDNAPSPKFEGLKYSQNYEPDSCAYAGQNEGHLSRLAQSAWRACRYLVQGLQAHGLCCLSVRSAPRRRHMAAGPRRAPARQHGRMSCSLQPAAVPRWWAPSLSTAHRP